MQIPIYLSEISPPALRATFPGVVYALGNVGSDLDVSQFFYDFVFHDR